MNPNIGSGACWDCEGACDSKLLVGRTPRIPHSAVVVLHKKHDIPRVSRRLADVIASAGADNTTER